MTASIWEIWQQNRNPAKLVVGLTSLGCLLNQLLPARFRTGEIDRFSFDAHAALLMVNMQLVAVALLLVFAIFSYTEFNPSKGSTGFPSRLFVLPVTSLQLVSTPIILGVAAIELVGLAWMALVFDPSPRLAGWVAVLMGTYMVLYQTILWTLPGLGPLRMAIQGLIGSGFIVAVSLPSYPQDVLPWWLREKFATAFLVGMALIAFVSAWMYVAHQRSGGGWKRGWFKGLIEGLVDFLPSRQKDFKSAGAAQFWFEWRRSGSQLPTLIGVLLLGVVLPFSWHLRSSAGDAERILAVILAMPLMLALPVGKAFSKPDFWSKDLSLPSFLAVRPLATEDLVAIKVRVAALSAAISWSLVIVFLSVWLPLWANLESLTSVWETVSRTFSHNSMHAQYAIAPLLILAGMLLTWRFLVSGLWIGLSGNNRRFTASAAPYALSPLALVPLALLFHYSGTLREWARDPERILSFLVSSAALALVARFSIAAFSWRKIGWQHVRQYLLVWLVGTVCLITLAVLLWMGLRFVLPVDIYQLRNLLILVALLVIPLARLGLAPAFLARNRHR